MMHAGAGVLTPSLVSHSGAAIDDIPLDLRKYICTMIDFSVHQGNGYWDMLVSELGFSERDSKNFLLAFPKHQSPTENLLRECSYRNYSVSTLSHVLKKVGLVTLAEKISDDFNKKGTTCVTPQMPPWPVVSDQVIRHTTGSSDHSSSPSEGDKIGGLDTIHYRYEEIEKGTKMFSPDMKLGAGAFGKVYKVKLKNTIFACKVLTINTESPHFSIISRHREQSDLRNELRYLAEYRHPNIIPLYGWSLDGKDPCLIYQYMKNGSLQDCLQRLTGNDPLTWMQRVSIACDTATGLQFLHTIKEKPLIHGDIKTANILLDDAFGAKLGDFGLAREGPRSQFTGSYIKLNDEHTPGTMGYLAFEYMQSKKLSVQVDTYAFGVVLLELYTGRRAFYRTEKHKAPTLLRDFMDEMANDCEGGPLEAENRLYESQSKEIVSLPRDIALRFVRLALECCHQKRNKRPSMSNVLKRLEILSEEIEEVMSNSDKDTQNSGSSSGSNNNPYPSHLNWPTPYSKSIDPSLLSHHVSRTPVESVDVSMLPQNHNNERQILDKKLSQPDQLLQDDFRQLHINDLRCSPYAGPIPAINPEMNGNMLQQVPSLANPLWLPNGMSPVGPIPQPSMPWNMQPNGQHGYPPMMPSMPLHPIHMQFYHPSQYPDLKMPHVQYPMPYAGVPSSNFSTKIPPNPNAENLSDTKSNDTATTPITPSTPVNYSAPDSFSSAEYDVGCSMTPPKTQICGQSSPHCPTAAMNPYSSVPPVINALHPPSEIYGSPNTADSDAAENGLKVNSVKAHLMDCLSVAKDDTDVSELLENSFKTSKTEKP